ncbi:MAG: LUD domain-containing protein [Bacteroidota bacterium]
MTDVTSREKVLKKIRKALTTKSTQEIGDVDKDSEIYTGSDEPLEIQFAQNFSALNGKFVFCENEAEFIENFKFFRNDNGWKTIYCLEPLIKEMLRSGNLTFSDNEEEFSNTDVGVTFCECLIARTGSIMVSSKQISGRRLPIYCNYHIVIAFTSQLMYNLKDGLKFIRDKYANAIPSMITTISGPSKTADIEKTLVQGAHGPKEVFVFLIDDLPMAD